MALKNGLLASGSFDTSIKIWEADTGKCTRVLEGHTHAILCIIQLENGYIASGSLDKTVIVWDIKSGKIVKMIEDFESPIFGIFEIGPEAIAINLNEPNVIVWNWASEKLNDISKQGKISAPLTCMKRKSDSEILLGCEDGKIYLFEPPRITQTYSHHNELVLNIEIIDSNRFVSNSTDLTITLWDFKKGTVVRTFDGFKDVATLIHYEPEYEMLVVTSLDGTIRGFDINGEEGGHAKHQINTPSILHAVVLGKRKINLKILKQAEQYANEVFSDPGPSKQESVKDESVINPTADGDATPLVVQDADSESKVKNLKANLETPDDPMERRADTTNLAEHVIHDAEANQNPIDDGLVTPAKPSKDHSKIEEVKTIPKDQNPKSQKDAKIKQKYEGDKQKRAEKTKSIKKEPSVYETEGEEDEEFEEEESEEGEESEYSHIQKEGGEAEGDEEQKSPPKHIDQSPSQGSANGSRSKIRQNMGLKQSQSDSDKKKMKINGLFELNKEFLYNPEREDMLSEGYCYIIATINQNNQNSICLWDLIQCTKVCEIDSQHHDEITSFTKIEDGSLLTGSKDGEINIFGPIF